MPLRFEYSKMAVPVVEGPLWKEVEFRNVTITLVAENPKEAYAQLCEMFSRVKGLEFTTDTFVEFGPERYEETEEQSTDVLMEH